MVSLSVEPHKTSETFFQPEFLSIFIVVTEIIPSITVAITVKTHVEVKKDIPIPTTAKTTSMIDEIMLLYVKGERGK